MKNGTARIEREGSVYEWLRSVRKQFYLVPVSRLLSEEWVLISILALLVSLDSNASDLESRLSLSAALSGDFNPKTKPLS